MHDPALQDQVRKLLDTLHRTGADDPELRVLLQRLDRDIHDTLGRSDAEAADTEFGARARGIASRFAVTHPRLGPLVEELANLLSAVGL